MLYLAHVETLLFTQSTFHKGLPFQ